MPKEKYIVITKEALRRKVADAQAKVDEDLIESARGMGQEISGAELLDKMIYGAMIWHNLAVDLFGEEEEH